MPIVNFKLMDLSDFVDGEEKIKKNIKKHGKHITSKKKC